MPKVGAPTNCALLKMAQGSSGPVMKPFQKIRNGAGASVLADGGVEPVRRSLEYSRANRATANTRARLKAMTPATQARGAVAGLIPLWCGSDALPLCAATAARSWVTTA